MVHKIVSITLKKEFFSPLINKKLPKPKGQLSGHNAGEPFCEEVFIFLKEKDGAKIFKQYQFLNSLYEKNINAKTVEERKKLLDPTIGLMINRGIESIKNWDINKFDEKQNDTADIIYLDKKKFNIIDVKTANLGKKGQQPNIISAVKLANICKSLIINKDYQNLEIFYLGVYWKLDEQSLIIKNLDLINLFKIPPKELYINWAAATQIQFHIHEVKQDFTGSKMEWSKQYLKTFIGSGNERIKKMAELLDQFSKFI